MSSYYGNIRFTIFGQSHSPAIGVTVDGLPVGFAPDLDELARFMARRAPGQNEYSTSRKEADAPEFISGLFHGRICGAPLTAVIRNTNTRSADYAELKAKPRPGHADLTAEIKYGGAQDHTGGGHFSGRLTAPLCIVGGLCKQVLEKEGIRISARVAAIGGVEDEAEWKKAIFRAKEEGDSLGGIIECVAEGVPVGLGGPMFDGLESRISHLVFGIPAVKGVEFGEGFGAAALRGSENNDPFEMRDGKIVTKTNHCGGILGGISNGMPIVLRAAVKPTPSIAKEQDTVDLLTGENAKLSVVGRHDPCIVPRAVPCVEAAVAIAVYDALLERRKEHNGFKRTET